MAADLERLAQEYLQRGHPEMADYLNAGAKKARKLGVPESFPVNGTVNVVKSPEAPVEIKRFSQEAREGLEKQGFTVLELTRRSITTLRDSGHKFWSTWHNQYPDFEALSSMYSEVAINRKELFLPKSQKKTFDEQVKMVEEFSNKLGAKIPGVEAIMGNASDYIDLAFVHLDKTQGRDYLFGKSDKYQSTRTKTLVGSHVAHVGRVDADLGLDVHRWDRGSRNGTLGVAPLVVPTSK